MYELKTSTLTKSVFLMIALLVAGLILALPTLWWVKIIALIILFTFSTYLYTFQLNQCIIKSFKKISDDEWLIEYKDGGVVCGSLQGDSLRGQLFSVLIFKLNQSKRSLKVLIARDTLSHKQYHRLQLQMKGLLH